MLRLRRPSQAELEALASQQRGSDITYVERGATLVAGPLPAGYQHDRHRVDLGNGDGVFEHAVDALKRWEPQRGSGLQVAADGPLEVGTTVAIGAPLPIGFAVAVCRVVAVVDEADRWGYAYGTLPIHPEQGEELFTVVRGPAGIGFEIVAFSRPRELLARVGGPVARRLQLRATRKYLDAMVAAVGP